MPMSIAFVEADRMDSLSRMERLHLACWLDIIGRPFFLTATSTVQKLAESSFIAASDSLIGMAYCHQLISPFANGSHLGSRRQRLLTCRPKCTLNCQARTLKRKATTFFAECGNVIKAMTKKEIK